MSKAINNKSTFLHARVPNDIAAAAKAFAAQEHRTLSSVLIQALEAFLDSRGAIHRDL